MARVESTREPARRNRVQLDLSAEQAALLALLETRLGARSRSDLLQEAIGVLAWYAQESLRGRRIVSVAPDELDALRHVVELARPAATLGTADLYRFLVARPHPWRRQLSLKGRNMTVGQLVGSMTAEGMTAAEAAERFVLPLEQVEEALAYYAANQELIDAELREERRQLDARRSAGGLATLPGRLRERSSSAPAPRVATPSARRRRPV